MGNYVKPGQLMKMRSTGQLSQLELTATMNLMGRGLKASIDEKAIYFQNGGEGPSARIKRGRDVAVVFAQYCHGEEQIKQYMSGLQAAGYNPQRA